MSIISYLSHSVNKLAKLLKFQKFTILINIQKLYLKFMYIIEVIPIQHLPKNVSQVLTYFHKSPLEQGALVEISVAHQNLLGIVASSTALDKVKNEIKSSSFKTKKIKKIVSEKPITSKSF